MVLYSKRLKFFKYHIKKTTEIGKKARWRLQKFPSKIINDLKEDTNKLVQFRIGRRKWTTEKRSPKEMRKYIPWKCMTHRIIQEGIWDFQYIMLEMKIFTESHPSHKGKQQQQTEQHVRVKECYSWTAKKKHYTLSNVLIQQNPLDGSLSCQNKV